MSNSRFKFVAIFILILICVASVAAAGFFYWQNRKLTQNEREIESVQAKVAKLMELPEEVPTLATVSDKEKLASQPFFKNAENGDKVLIYPQAGRAILYRPSTNKIVDVAPLQITNEAIPSSDSSGANEAAAKSNLAVLPSPSPVPDLPTVSFYNGTEIAGLGTKAETVLKQSYPTLQIVGKTNAVKRDYSSSVVVDISGFNTTFAQDLANKIGAQVAYLPQGETPPNSEVLVILGSEFQNL